MSYSPFTFDDCANLCACRAHGIDVDGVVDDSSIWLSSREDTRPISTADSYGIIDFNCRWRSASEQDSFHPFKLRFKSRIHPSFNY